VRRLFDMEDCKMRIDHVCRLCEEYSGFEEEDKHAIYYLARHVVELCSNNFEEDIDRVKLYLNYGQKKTDNSAE